MVDSNPVISAGLCHWYEDFDAKTPGDLGLLVGLEVHQPYLQPDLPKTEVSHAQIIK